ncbi:unnamed protein product [Tetraodon nigroviridis]|uniref:C-C motif chemokine n=1 Tax=Tetraodon nigroviridis TaxID=99883 RepID=Q4RWR5_TETNG|nr:unnamed protein product [Tetraodon nigroviridis]
MRLNALFFLTITACVCLALAQITYEDCCLKYIKKVKPRIQKYAVSYRLQVLDGGCNLPAVIFVMKKGRVVCTDPKEQWVTELMRQIDGRRLRTHSNKSTKHNSRG